MCDDTVTASPRAPLKDSSPCQKPPPPHAEPTVWGAMGQVVLNQHFKAAPLSIIRGCAPSSLRTGQCVQRLRMTSPLPGCLFGRRGWRKGERKQRTGSLISTSCIFISLIALLRKKKKKKKSSTLSVYHKGASAVRQPPWEPFMCRIQFKIPSLCMRLCFIFFPLAPDVMNTICKIVLHLLCTQRGQSVCFAARL